MQISVSGIWNRVQRSIKCLITASDSKVEYGEGPEMYRMVFKQKGPVCLLRMTGTGLSGSYPKLFYNLFLADANFERKQVTATSASVIFEVIYFQNSFMTTLQWSAWSRESGTGCSFWQFGTQVALVVAVPVLDCTGFFKDPSQSSACGYLCYFKWTMSRSVQRRFGYIQPLMSLIQRDSLCFHCCSVSCGSGCVLVQWSWWLHLALEHWRNMYDNKAKVFLCNSDLDCTIHIKRLFFFLLLVAFDSPCRMVIVHKNWFWVAACNSPTIFQCCLPGI